MREDLSELRPILPVTEGGAPTPRIATEPGHGASTAPALCRDEAGHVQPSSLWLRPDGTATARLRELQALLHRTDELGNHMRNAAVARKMRVSQAQIETGIRWLKRLHMDTPKRNGALRVKPVGSARDYSRGAYIKMEHYGQQIRTACDAGDALMATIFAEKHLRPYDDFRFRPSRLIGGPAW